MGLSGIASDTAPGSRVTGVRQATTDVTLRCVEQGEVTEWASTNVIRRPRWQGRVTYLVMRNPR